MLFWVIKPMMDYVFKQKYLFIETLKKNNMARNNSLAKQYDSMDG